MRFVNNMRLALDLRKTLWWWKLANVLVFERQEHAEALRQKLRRKDKTVERWVTNCLTQPESPKYGCAFTTATALSGCACCGHLVVCLSSMWKGMMGAVVTACADLQALVNTVAPNPVVCLCSLRLIALDGYTFNVKVGSSNFRLPLDGVSHCLGAAGPDAAATPLDLRLRCIKVGRLRVLRLLNRLCVSGF